MDEQLLQELYGSETTQAEEEIKLAQVELVEAVAAEAGVDLNELDDQELAKFAEYVLSDEDELYDNADLQEDAYAQEKLAEADMMGRQMARSYMDELQQQTISQGDTGMYNDTQEKIASAMQDVAEAWHFEKIAKEKKDNTVRNTALGAVGTGALAGGAAYGLGRMSQNKLTEALARRQKYMDGTFKQLPSSSTALATKTDVRKAIRDSKIMKGMDEAVEAARDSRFINMSPGRAAAIGGGAALLGGGAAYLASRSKKKKQQKKTAALLDYGYEALAIADLYEPEEFAKEAEFRAAEILAANGIHPETFEEIHPEEIKLASFPGVEEAIDQHEAEALLEYNEMLDTAALHIIDELFE
tara:strand:- start:247 stop:1317 length:1071 start_codon:yes stop_codon:yes gene_type:complete